MASSLKTTRGLAFNATWPRGTHLTRPRGTRLVKLSLAWLCLFGVSSGYAQPPVEPNNRSAIDAQFVRELEQIAQKCDELNLVDEARFTRAWPVSRLDDRIYCFVPPPVDPHAPGEEAGQIQKFWYQKFREVRGEYADQLWELASRQAETQPAQAFVLLHEILRENPDHEPARRALGYDLTNDGWRQDRAKIRSRKSNRDHTELGWKRRTFWQTDSPHFRIYATAEPARAEELAEAAERWYTSWRQLFFHFWHRGQNVSNWIRGASSDTGSSHKFTIVLFRNREQYLHDLASVSGIEVSSGFYSSEKETSFFYVADTPHTVDTWKHELTHQWFQETIPSRDVNETESGLWLIEGIAMFMESLREQGAVTTVGGVDAQRLQFARLRFHRERFYLPFQELQQLDRRELQTHPDLPRLYSQAAGVCHFLMSGPQRAGLIEFLQAFYSKHGNPDFATQVLDPIELDKAYRAWLLPVDVDRIARIQPHGQTGLAFPKSGLGSQPHSADALKAIGQCRDLTWLELTHNPIDDAGFEKLRDLNQLQQLFLDSTRLTDQSCAAIGDMSQLRDLDLSATGITDAGLQELANLKELQALWLAKTNIRDSGLESLMQLTKLKLLDIRATQVTRAGIEKLQAALGDGLRIVH